MSAQELYEALSELTTSLKVAKLSVLQGMSKTEVEILTSDLHRANVALLGYERKGKAGDPATDSLTRRGKLVWKVVGTALGAPYRWKAESMCGWYIIEKQDLPHLGNFWLEMELRPRELFRHQFLENAKDAAQADLDARAAALADVAIRMVATRDALRDLETACDNLNKSRSQATYDSMLKDGASDLLLALDGARRQARELLK